MALVKTVDERSAMLKEIEGLCHAANAVQAEIDGLETCLRRVVRPEPSDGEQSEGPKRHPETVEEALGLLECNLRHAHRRIQSLRTRLQLG